LRTQETKAKSKKDRQRRETKTQPNLQNIIQISEQLRADNHFISIVLLNTFLSLSSSQISLTPTEVHTSLDEQFAESLMKVNGDAPQLFLSLVSVELAVVPDIKLILSEGSVCSLVWRFIRQSFDITEIITPNLKIIQEITSTKFKLLSEADIPHDDRVFLKKRLLSCIKGLLCPDNIPPVICALCSSSYKIGMPIIGTESDIKMLFISTLIITHFLIPSLQTLGCMSSALQSQQKCAELMCRFLGKLCHRTKFELIPPTCLLNEVLNETIILYETFCDRVFRIGENSTSKIQKTTIKGDGVTFRMISKLADFVCQNEDQIIFILHNSFSLPLQPFDVYHQLKEKIVFVKSEWRQPQFGAQKQFGHEGSKWSAASLSAIPKKPRPLKTGNISLPLLRFDISHVRQETLPNDFSHPVEYLDEIKNETEEKNEFAIGSQNDIRRDVEEEKNRKIRLGKEEKMKRTKVGKKKN
jgi:hypothetical protein